MPALQQSPAGLPRDQPLRERLKFSFFSELSLS